MILQQICIVNTIQPVADNIFLLSFQAPLIAASILPGQFLNIKIEDRTDPLLRRPFSVYRRDGDALEIIFNVVGKGTTLLSRKHRGETIDVLGTLGVPFGVGGADFETALLVGGGLGVAPLPIATMALLKAGRKVFTFLGARTAAQLVTAHLENLHIATDDGSRGFCGTVVELVEDAISRREFVRPKVFGCGPTAMLRALAALTMKRDIACEVSLEGPMACGIGICQGCPVELAGEEEAFALMCKDGPVFDVRRIKL